MVSIPCARIGTIDFPSGLSGLPDSPSMVGMLGPYTSASSTPTRAPSAAKASARFTEVVDFPTPPLPEPTARMLRMCGSGLSSPCTARGWTVMLAPTLGKRSFSLAQHAPRLHANVAQCTRDEDRLVGGHNRYHLRVLATRWYTGRRRVAGATAPFHRS